MLTRIGGVPEHFNLPWESALFDLAASGWELSWRDFPDGSGAMARALGAREIDIAVMLTTSTVKAIGDGLAASIVGSHVTSPLRWGIHVDSSSPVRDVSQIQGRSIAISRFGSGSHLVPIVDAQLRGWETDSMEFVEVADLPGACAALAAGHAEVFFWEQFMTRPHVQSGALRLLDLRLPPWPSFLVVAHEDWLARGLNVAEILAAVDARCAACRADEEATVERINARFHIDRPGAKEWLSYTDWRCVPSVPREALRAASMHLSDALGIPEQTPEQLVHVSTCALT